jgi:hypothetical protein
MKCRVRLATWGVLSTCLLAAALPAAAQQPRARIPLDGSHAFRNILKLHKLQPLASAAELAKVPTEEAVLIVFGDPRGIREGASQVGGLGEFQRNGGAILIATDRFDIRGRLSELGVVVRGSAVEARDPALAFQGEKACPVLRGLGNVPHPLFRGLNRGLVTNSPSYLVFPPLRGTDLRSLVRFPPGCVARGPAPEIAPLTFIAAPLAPNGDRVVVIAGHGVFMNGMLGLNADNFAFAWNCVEWLSEKGKRKYALLIEDGRVMRSFDVPLAQLPLPPLKAITRMVRDLEEENFFNRLLLDNVPRARLLRYLFLGASGLLLFYGLHRLIRAHHRGETAAPRLAAKVQDQAGAEVPLVARRNDAALREGNCYEAARDLARLCFEGEGGEPPAAPPRVRRGGRRLRREVERLWRLAYGGTPTPVAPAEFAALVAQAARVQAAVESGALSGK